MKKIIAGLLLLLSTAQVSAQLLEEKYQDDAWAYYNTGLNSFLWSGIGGALKVGIDEYYIDDALRFNDAVFHDVKSYNVETFSVLDFSDPINEELYELIFEAGDTVNLMQALLYLGDNYGAYYHDVKRIRALTLEERKRIKDSCQLENSTKMVLYEWWYYDRSNGGLRSFIRSYGIYDATNPKADRPAVWVDIVTLQKDLVNRFKVKKGDGFVPIDEWLRSWDIARGEVLVTASGYPDITIADPYHNEMDAHIYRTLIEMKSHHLKSKKGKVKSKEITGNFKGVERSGVWTYQPGKQILAEFTYKSNFPDGPYTLYYDDGSVREKGQFKQGVKDGTAQAFYRNGKLMTERNYNSGVLEGKHTQYFSDGNTHSTWMYVSNQPHGVYTQYNTDGTVKLKGRFLHGILAGEWTYKMYLTEVLCGFLQDDFINGEVYEQIEAGAMDDCRADFVIRFNHDESEHCHGGMCVIPEPIGKIK